MSTSLSIWWHCKGLGSAFAWRRQASSDALVRIGKPAVQPLIQMVTKSGPLGPQYRGPYQAAQTLGRLKDPAALQPLVRALRNTYGDLSLSVVEALGDLGDVRAVESLIRQVPADDHCTHDHFNAIVAAVVKVGKPAVDPLMAALLNSSKHIRAAAARALGLLGDPRAVEPLIGMMRRQSTFSDREEAAQALRVIGDKRAVEPLIQQLGDASRESIRCTAAEILGELGDASTVEPLLHAFSTATDADDRPRTFRLRLEQSLARLGAASEVDRARRATAPKRKEAFAAIQARLHEGMSYAEAVSILGAPSQTIGGAEVLGAFGKVSGAGRDISIASGMLFVEWKREEGTYRANNANGILTDINAWPAEG